MSKSFSAFFIISFLLIYNSCFPYYSLASFLLSFPSSSHAFLNLYIFLYSASPRLLLLLYTQLLPSPTQACPFFWLLVSFLLSFSPSSTLAVYSASILAYSSFPLFLASSYLSTQLLSLSYSYFLIFSYLSTLLLSPSFSSS
jgi:hypothetical protein